MLQLDPIWNPHTQQCQFRMLLDVMSHPGRCRRMSIIPLEGPTVLGVLACLLDREVSLADPHHILRPRDWPMLQARALAAEQADFIVCDGSMPPDFVPKLGSLSSPEQSATLVIVVKALCRSGFGCLKLTGPGIPSFEKLCVEGLAKEWFDLRNEWCSAFPLGVDMILFDGQFVTALPRTTHVEAY